MGEGEDKGGKADASTPKPAATNAPKESPDKGKAKEKEQQSAGAGQQDQEAPVVAKARYERLQLSIHREKIGTTREFARADNGGGAPTNQSPWSTSTRPVQVDVTCSIASVAYDGSAQSSNTTHPGQMPAEYREIQALFSGNFCYMRLGVYSSC